MPPSIDWTDWSLGPGRHPVQGAVHAGLAALSVTAVGEASGLLPSSWPLVAGGMLGAASAISAAWREMPREAVIYRAVCCLGAGVWSSCTLAWSSVWSTWPLVTLATGSAVAAVIGTGLARRDQRTVKPSKAERPESAAGESSKDPVAAEWQERLRHITRRLVTVLRVERWNPPTGFTLWVLLPDDGTIMRDLKDYESQFAANLPEGCNVEVLPGGAGKRRVVRIRVATENAIAETRHLDEDTSPLSIENPLPIGDHADRSHAAVNLRYSCLVLVGQTDSGKSNTLNVIMHQLGRCTNAIVWAIDLSGNGRFPRPWVRAWAEGRAPRPAIDWAAVTPEHALQMTEAAINVINGRTAEYQQLMFEANDDKLPVSPDVPEIVILVDEFADLPDPVKERLETISNTGRGAGVRPVSSCLRAIGADISRAMIAQARERIGMRVSDEAELQYLFDTVWGRGRIDPASMPYQGSGLLSTGASSPMPFKARRLEPRRIDTAAIAVADLRPALDEVSARLADTVTFQVRDKYGNPKDEQIIGVYTNRWERTLPLMFPTDTPSPSPVRPEPARVAAAAQAPAGEETAVDLDDSARRLNEASERARQAREAADAEAELAGADFSVVEGWLAQPPADGGEAKPPARARMRQIVQEHRRDGIGPRAVWQRLKEEGYPTRESTVITWMGADASAGILAQPGGKGQPYTVGPNFTLEQP